MRWCCWLVVVVVAVATGRAGAEDPLAFDAGEGRSLLGPSLRIERIDVLRGPTPAVRLQLSGPAHALTRTLGGDGGAAQRIYVDVADAILGAGARRILAGTGPVRRVRSAQFGPDTVRVVVELAHALPFSVGSSGHTVMIALGEDPHAAPRTPARPAKRTPTEVAARRQPPGKVKGAASPPVVARPRPVPSPAPIAAERHEPPAAEGASTEEAPQADALFSPAPPLEIAAAPLPQPEEHDPAPETAPVTLADTAPPATLADAAAPVTVNGVPFIWPDLDADAYQTPGAGAFRRLVTSWRLGERPTETGPRPLTPAAFYLAADLAYLAAAAKQGEFLTAATAYGAALRQAPDFPDAPRGQFLLGQADLAVGLGPEAGVAFATLERRFPHSSLGPYARLGEVAALRARRRLSEARHLLDRVLAETTGDVLCRACLEEVALGRANHDPAATVAGYRRLGESCPDALAVPGMLADQTEALMAAGDRDGVRGLVFGPRPARADEEEARLHLLGGTLFGEGDNAYRAREEYEQVIQLAHGGPLAAEARLRLALLDGQQHPERLTEVLSTLADKPGPATLRAAMLGEVAEANARAGRFEEALALLDRAAALGPAGQAQADGRRAEMLGRWIAALRTQGDVAALVTVYAAYATDIKELATLDDRVTVADALGRLGLHAAAASLLQQPAQQRPEAAVALAEETLAAGDPETARAVVRRVPRQLLAPELLARLQRTAVRAALQVGDAETAAAEAATADDGALRAEVGAAMLALPGGPARARALLAPVIAGAEPPVRALLVAGAAAMAEDDWDAAADAYRRALAHANGPERVEAGAGLARTARARGDGEQMAAALDQLGGTGDALLRRAVAAVGRAVAQAPAVARADGR